MTDEILDCGHPPTEPRSPLSTGYGKDSYGKRHCFACCAKMDRETMRNAKPGERFTAYVDSDGKKLTTWPGSELGRVLSWGAIHPWARFSNYDDQRRYVRVVDLDGNEWHGTAAPGMYAALRKCKHKSR